MYHSPAVLTKELKIQTVPGVGRRIRLSSNFLRGFGFDAATRIQMDFSGGRGIITPSVEGDWKVHERAYGNRKNNPTETVIEVASQSLIDRLVPASGYERVHFTLKSGEIEVRPVKDSLFHIRKHFKKATSLQAFMALSSGIDAYAFSSVGFKLGAILEYRPKEARDSNDLTETGLCTFLRNNPATLAVNEDIATADLDRIAAHVDRHVGPVGVLSIGLQCDDFSLAKSSTLKKLEVAEFRPSSRELGYYATKLIEKVKPACVFIENVPGWHGSESQGVLGAVLTRLGYHVKAEVLNGADFGSYTARRRCYFLASIFPGFAFPAPTGRNEVPLRTVLASEIIQMVDVSHTSTIAKAESSGRSRFTSLDATVAPTVMKSQARCTKDGLYFQEEGKILRPALGALKKLHSIPADFRFDAVSDEIATEQVGQGIEFPLHTAVAKAVHDHLALNHHSSQQMSLNIEAL